MASQKRKQRLFSGMNYREVQRSNTNRKKKLPKADQVWLKTNGYRNVGWDNVIKLYEKINDFLAAPDTDDPTLEELFLKADQIGKKYQTTEEVNAFEQAFQTEVHAISDQIDQQFPDQEVEMVDYSQSSRSHPKRKTAKSRKR
ncbi:hypothetical protein IQ273_09710 [Nodosilinea sp. LEGE 07298]|uniref:hypothetical protein n=1 Tax=Nodosilinea sp. LEGE 07298 TaxID=2777970 RepID=UPI001882B9E5|nr:hypothetical protein [Nodosilinea sp. LEGE 07298]MBE9109689.1 hypothetical protein [Nodosilinea sp. LEGE 07298]